MESQSGWTKARCSALLTGLTERLFNQLESSTKNERHEVKLMMTNLISRLIGIHQVRAREEQSQTAFPRLLQILESRGI